MQLFSSSGLAETKAEIECEESSAAYEQAIDQFAVVAHKIEQFIRNIAAIVTVVCRTNIKSQLANSIVDVFRYAPSIGYEETRT
ncbi:MAG: hypothetical protein IIA07_14125 [Proteobacteria bacterium]|nr:hypothetical protein [Pseudomonadota bacterium]